MLVVVCVFPNVLPAVAAATACVTVVASSLLVSSPVVELVPAKALALLPTYLRLPAVLRKDIAVNLLVYASWMKVYRPGYVLLGMASHVSNSLMGKMPDCIRRRTPTLMLSNDLDLLALLCAIKEHFRCLSGGEWTLEQRFVVE